MSWQQKGLPAASLVLAAHPNWRESRVNRRLLAAAQGVAGRAGARPVRPLPRLRHRRGRRAGRWHAGGPASCCCTRSSGTPCRALMKLWLDEVLAYGWAYGPGGTRPARQGPVAGGHHRRAGGLLPPRRATTATSSTPSCRPTSRPRRCAACASCRRCVLHGAHSGERRGRGQRTCRSSSDRLRSYPRWPELDELRAMPGLRRARPRDRPGVAA